MTVLTKLRYVYIRSKRIILSYCDINELYYKIINQINLVIVARLVEYQFSFGAKKGRLKRKKLWEKLMKI